MVIKIPEALGSLHGYPIARRIEQISGNQLVLNQGTLTRAGRKQLHKEEAQWQRCSEHR